MPSLHRVLKRLSLPKLAVLGGDVFFPGRTEAQLQNVFQLLHNLRGNGNVCFKVMVLVAVLCQVGHAKHSAA